MVDSLQRYFATTPYELIEKVGEGGFGEVWKAQRREQNDLCSEDYDEPASQHLGKSDQQPPFVAIKILFEESGQLGPKLQHQHIVQIYETGSMLGRPYQVMEWIGGPTLRELLNSRKAHLPLSLVRKIVLPLIDALNFAHARGVIHRDVKPENILLAPQITQGSKAQDYSVKLADFGLATTKYDRVELSASLNSAQNLAGSAFYIAPELLIQRQAPSEASDFYSLGIVLFELLTGQMPSGLEYPTEIRPGLDKGFDKILKSLLSRQPERRLSPSSLQQQLLQLFGLRSKGRAVFLDTKTLSRKSAPQAQDKQQTHKSSPSLTQADKTLSPKSRKEMVLIDRCSFVQGDDQDPFARPKRLVTLDPFWVDVYPVSNADYLSYCQETGAKPPSSWRIKASSWSRRQTFRLTESQKALPVTGITWQEASDYAAWCGKRLLTEAEWERCAQGPEGLKYPYGDKFDPAKIHTDHSGLSPSSRFAAGASSEGVFDLTGNCWEWCSDWFQRDSYAQDRDPLNPKGPKEGKARVIRGGYSERLPGSGSAWYRSKLRPDLAKPNVGFRCARSHKS